MEVVSECPLTVGSVLWQSGPKAWTLTLVAKATFALAPGESPLAEAQEQVHPHDRHWDSDPSRSLAIATDLVPFKRRPEVMIVGFAHAPGGRSVGSLTVRVTMASIDKAFEVRGDQHFTRDGKLSEPVKWKRMPLRWERAAGGPDTSNPVGVPTGTEARFDSWGRCPLPNLVPVGTMTMSPHDPIEPVGFAPIAPRWPARAARLAGLPDGFDASRWTAAPLPEHFDAAYFNVAPLDQQLAALDGTESLLLENLHPAHAVLATRFAPTRPLAVFEWGKGRSLDIGLTCDTLVIDSELGLATLAYRGHIALDHPGRAGRIVVTLDRPAEPQRAEPQRAEPQRAEPQPSAPQPAVPDVFRRVQSIVSTIAARGGEKGATLPFTMNDDELPTLPKRRAPLGRPRTGTVQGTEIPRGPALPFRTEASAAGSATGTLLPFRAPAVEALPFRRPEDADETVIVQGGESPFAAARAAPTFGLPPLATPPVAAAPQVIAPAPVAHAAAIEEEILDADALLEEIEPDDDDEEQRETQIAPSPLAKLPLHAYSLERCARIAASLALRPADRASILASNRLDDRTWARLDAHWAQVLVAETERQESALLQVHDAEYIAQIEAERGPIAPHEYARVVVATERGAGDLALAALRLPMEAGMRIRRVWTARMARDMDLGMRVQKALAEERAR